MCFDCVMTRQIRAREITRVVIAGFKSVSLLGWRYPGLQFSCGHTGSIHPEPGSGQGVQETRHR